MHILSEIGPGKEAKVTHIEIKPSWLRFNGENKSLHYFYAVGRILLLIWNIILILTRFSENRKLTDFASTGTIQ